MAFAACDDGSFYSSIVQVFIIQVVIQPEKFYELNKHIICDDPTAASQLAGKRLGLQDFDPSEDMFTEEDIAEYEAEENFRSEERNQDWDKASLEFQYHKILIDHQFADFSELPESVQNEIKYLSDEYDKLADYCMECGCKATIDCQFH